ncbi:PA domain-containing protein [Ilumatobacter sp.]|uniref:PA domain-containing protein n=1 Tax=Ilumatobacter sp. TaxID=1967498 RepID=UPI003AF5B5CF
MRTRTKVAAGLLSAVGLFFSTGVAAHDSPNDGHIPKDVNYGFELVGRDTLAGVSEFGNYTDVWSHKGFAYVGTFQEPCSDAGVFIADVDAAIAQFQNGGSVSGATVAEIKSAPNTRINDVKVHTVGDTDVLITTQEPCGMQIPGWAQSGGNAPFQVGQGGISLYDVTDPTKPKALKKNYLEFEGVHNTFPWTDSSTGKSYLIGTADTFDFFDTFFVDISKPQSPTLLTITGALDWIPQGVNLDQLETGSSASINNHDVWVEEIDGTPTAVVSYWDLGFVTLDVSDPANPVFLNDSTYVDPDPITGQPYEGNAHAAVFGGEGDYIFGGDEDFSPSSFGISYAGAEYAAGIALFGDDPNTLAGNVEYVGGDGCASVPAPTVPEPQVALIDRGACFFSQKGFNAESAGYEGYIITNNAGDGLINMSAGDPPLPTIPGVFIGQSDGDAIKANQGQAVSTSSIFDGWGYLHIINNTGGDLSVPSEGMDSTPMTVPTGHELGYYAPYQAVEEGFGTDFGDLTMHNIEVDPTNQHVTPTFNAGPRMFVSWYSLGMRALEYRPGHYHTNANDEGSWSQNVHEVGRWIDDAGSNFWGIHVDEATVGGDTTQVILASDRNLGLYVFTWECVDPDGEGPLYCESP